MKTAFVYMNNVRQVGRGAGYVAGAVIRAGHPLTFFDTFYTPIREVARQVSQEDFDVLMISTMSTLFPQAAKLAGLVKSRRRIPILLGGIHAACEGGKILEEHREIDYLCIGEGESMVVEFLQKLGSPSLFEVRNLAYRSGGKVVVNPLRPAEDLAQSPPFPWYLFSKQSLVPPAMGVLYVNATRGCPYNCAYCGNGVYLKQYGKRYLRCRPVEDVLEEVALLEDAYRPALFHFSDEMVLWNRDYAGELFYSLKKRLNVPFGCMARVEAIDPQVTRMLADTGCRYVAMGVECGDEAFRREKLNRHMSNEQIERAFTLLNQAGICTMSFNMIGYPFENDDALTEATLRLNQKLAPDFVHVSIFYPFPGTRLYEYCLENGLIDNKKMAHTYNYYADSVLKGVSLARKRRIYSRILSPNGEYPRFSRPPAESPGRVLSLGKPGCGKKILMISTQSGHIDPTTYRHARRLVQDGHKVILVSGFHCPSEQHYFLDGVHIHRYSFQHRKRGLRRILAELRHPRRYRDKLRHRGLRAWLRENQFSTLVEDTLDAFPVDVVHVLDEALFDTGTRLARKWGAELAGPQAALKKAA